MRDDIDVVVTPPPPTANEGSTVPAAPRGTVVIRDEKAKRAWSGEGKTLSEAATEAVRKLLGDRRAREYTE